MSGISSIEWTDRTWNPVTGCTKVSKGCKHCYAEGVSARFWSHQYVHSLERGFIPVKAYRADRLDGRIRRFTDVITHDERLLEPLSWRKASKVFVNSMSDLFHEAVPDAFIDRVFAVMALAERHTFQVLTKRPERMREYLAGWGRPSGMGGRLADVVGGIADALPHQQRWDASYARGRCFAYPLSNVWLGVSVEDQATADARIPLLLQTPAAIRFVSYEPALGPVDFTELPSRFDRDDGDGECNRPLLRLNALKGGHWCGACFHDSQRLDWVIVGGESGRGARPFDIAWARKTVAQCRAAGVAVFVKQMGANSHGYLPEARAFTEALVQVGAFITGKGGDPAEWPEDLRVREFPR